MAFSFGAAQPAQPPQTSSLFGSANTTAAPKPAFGGFGQASTSTPAQGSTSLFGSTSNATQTQQPSTGLFGSTSTQPQPSTGGLFGSMSNTTQPQQQSGGLFGSTNIQAQPQQTGGLFGSTTTQQPQQSTSLFGGQAQQSQTQPQQGQQTSLFGGLNSTQKPGGLFGSTTTTGTAGAPATGTGTGGGLFGGFGSATQQQQPQQGQSGGPFGGLGATQTSGGLFGAGASTLQQPQAQQPNQLGQSQQAPTNPLQRSTLFDSATFRGSLFSQSAEKSIETKLGDVQNSYDPSHPDYRFRCFFYNRVADGTAGQYGKPNGVSDDDWNKAKREAPDVNFVPVLASGWTDMEKRVAMQEAITGQHQNVIKQIQDKLAKLTRETSVQSAHQLITLQRRLADLQHRVLKLAAQTAAIQPGSSSGQLTQEEIAMKATLEHVQGELEGRKTGGRSTAYGIAPLGTPGTPRRKHADGRMAASVNELYGAIEEIRRRKRLAGAMGGEEGWLADERVLAQVAEILSTQQMALEKLQAVIKDGEATVKVIDENVKGLYRS